jgi:hypothetical protein
MKEYKRVYYLITETYSKVIKKDFNFVTLAVNCLVETSNWDEMIYYLGNDNEYNILIKDEENNELISHLSFCRGLAYEKLENKNKAILYYQDSFFKNIYNFEVKFFVNKKFYRHFKIC